jgi:hypothetical protein
MSEWMTRSGVLSINQTTQIGAETSAAIDFLTWNQKLLDEIKVSQLFLGHFFQLLYARHLPVDVILSFTGLEGQTTWSQLHDSRHISYYLVVAENKVSAFRYLLTKRINYLDRHLNYIVSGIFRCKTLKIEHLFLLVLTRSLHQSTRSETALNRLILDFIQLFHSSFTEQRWRSDGH